MVLADSHDTPRTSCYSGNDYSTTDCFNYGTLTLYGPGSHPIRLHPVATAVHGSTPQPLPTTPTTQPLPGITRDRFSLIRVRSPLLTESQLFSLPAGTEMFHFPTFPPTGLYIQPAVTPTPESVHAGFPHSDILGSPFGYQLPQAYRRFPRPSSAPTTKASTVRSCKLTQPTTHKPGLPAKQAITANTTPHTPQPRKAERVAALSHEYNQTPHHNQQLRHGTQN